MRTLFAYLIAALAIGHWPTGVDTTTQGWNTTKPPVITQCLTACNLNQ